MTEYLQKIELFATRMIVGEVPEKVVHHNIKWTRRLVDAVKEIAEKENLPEEELEITLITAWMYGTGFRDVDMFHGEEIFQGCVKCTQQISKMYLEEINYPKEKIEKIFQMLENSIFTGDPKNKMEEVFVDALNNDFANPKGLKYLKSMYEELIILNTVHYGKKSWYDVVLELLGNFHYRTDYGKEFLEPKKEKLIQKLLKERKKLEKEEGVALKRELNINDEELKSLKKSLNKAKGRDDRGIQTLFRIISKNHYTLITTVDRKANIMISVSAVIVTLAIGGVIGPATEVLEIQFLPIVLISFTSMLSILFAIFAIRPVHNHGSFTEDEVRNKQGNLLYFGNFHNMHVKDYEWGMLQMLNDRDYLYSSMIRDIYYLGQSIKKKHRNLRISLNIFMVGFFVTIISFLYIKLIIMGGIHFV